MPGERIDLHRARHQRVHHGCGSRITPKTMRSAAGSHGTRSRSPLTSANSIQAGAQGALLRLVSTKANVTGAACRTRFRHI